MLERVSRIEESHLCVQATVENQRVIILERSKCDSELIFHAPHVVKSAVAFAVENF